MNGKLVKLIRDVEGYNQHEFANLIGVSRSTIAYIEAGYIQVSSEVSRKIAEAVGYDRVEEIKKIIK